MGWKALKEHFNIKHDVHADEDWVYIGTGLLPQWVRIHRKTGALSSETSKHQLKETYPELIQARPETLLSLLAQEDHFEASIPVFTFRNGQIVEKRCETPGWPHATHDGELMYDNTHSTDIGQVVKWAKQDLECSVAFTRLNLTEAKKQVKRLQEALTEYEAKLAAFENAYTEVANTK